jgi:hypothetical protein
MSSVFVVIKNPKRNPTISTKVGLGSRDWAGPSCDSKREHT